MSIPTELSQWVVTFRATFGGMSKLEIGLVVMASAIALYSLLHLWFIGQREHVQERIEVLRSNLRQTRRSEEEPARQAAPPRWVQRFGQILAASPIVGSNERTRLSELLTGAGIKGGPGQVATLIAAKCIGLLLMVLAGWLVMEVQHLFVDASTMRICVLAGLGLGGWRLADIIVGMLGRRRKAHIEEGLPDALDMLVICAEAGLSLDQSIAFVAREIAVAFPEVAKEFEITTAELRVLGDRREALENLGRRVGIPVVRSVVGTLVQTMKYGTPLAHSLRVLSAELRTIRLLRIEERAAQLPVLLSVPLVAFILPCTFLVLAGPAVLQIIDTLGKVNTTH